MSSQLNVIFSQSLSAEATNIAVARLIHNNPEFELSVLRIFDLRTRNIIKGLVEEHKRTSPSNEIVDTCVPSYEKVINYLKATGMVTEEGKIPTEIDGVYRKDKNGEDCIIPTLKALEEKYAFWIAKQKLERTDEYKDVIVFLIDPIAFGNNTKRFEIMHRYMQSKAFLSKNPHISRKRPLSIFDGVAEGVTNLLYKPLFLENGGLSTEFGYNSPWVLEYQEQKDTFSGFHITPIVVRYQVIKEEGKIIRFNSVIRFTIEENNEEVVRLTEGFPRVPNYRYYSKEDSMMPDIFAVMEFIAMNTDTGSEGKIPEYSLGPDKDENWQGVWCGAYEHLEPNRTTSIRFLRLFWENDFKQYRLCWNDSDKLR